MIVLKSYSDKSLNINDLSKIILIYYFYSSVFSIILAWKSSGLLYYPYASAEIPIFYFLMDILFFSFFSYSISFSDSIDFSELIEGSLEEPLLEISTFF